MSDLDDLIARMPSRPRVPTGFPMLDALLGGGFPEGLTVIVCKGPDALAVMSRWGQRLQEITAGHPILLHVVPHPNDSVDSDRARMRAMLDRTATVLIRLANKAGEPPRDDERSADVLLRASATYSRLVLQAQKNQGRPRSTVRFEVAPDKTMTEFDVVPDPAP